MRIRKVVGATAVKGDLVLAFQKGDFLFGVGGKVEEGESWEEALKREVKEEIKCEVDSFRLVELNQTLEGDILWLMRFYLVDLRGSPRASDEGEPVWLSPGKVLRAPFFYQSLRWTLLHALTGGRPLVESFDVYLPERPRPKLVYSQRRLFTKRKTSSPGNFGDPLP